MTHKFLAHHFVRWEMFQPVVNLFYPFCFLSDQLIHTSVITFNNTAPVMFMNLLHKNQFQTKDKQQIQVVYHLNIGFGSLMVCANGTLLKQKCLMVSSRFVIYHLLKKKAIQQKSMTSLTWSYSKMVGKNLERRQGCYLFLSSVHVLSSEFTFAKRGPLNMTSFPTWRSRESACILQVILSLFVPSGTSKLIVTASLSWDHLYTGGEELFDPLSAISSSVSLNFRTGGFSSSSPDITGNSKRR